MSAQDSPFRGYRSIELVRQKIEKLVAWLRAHKPDTKRITLYRREYDLIARWPKAGRFLQFEYRDGEIYYREFHLVADNSAARYRAAA
jgi:hypothetical protein